VVTVPAERSGGLTFGLLYDLRNPPEWERPWTDIYAETLDFAVWSEELGYGGAWVPEHHVADDGYASSPLVALAAIASRTRRMKLGTGVALAPFYHPVRFAEDSAMVDVISGGRLEIGLALGYRRRETAAYGIDFSQRPGRMDEFLQIVRRLWSGEQFDFAGRYYTLDNAFVALRPPRGGIPLFVGAYSEKAMARVARHGDGYLGAHELYDVYAAKLCECGKEVSSGRFYQASLPLVVADDPERAMHELAPYFHYVGNMYGVWLNEDSFDAKVQVDAAPRKMSLDEFKASGQLQVLTPAQAVDLFRAMRAKTPVEHVTIAVPPGIPLAKYAPYAELFAKEVIPAFR
jgi:alkanesulfonate monooxygenase SsuD/methylene tetrahydromethanopterin reductase-like flavin-dependent oxidoreductase (luciferase family)